MKRLTLPLLFLSAALVAGSSCAAPDAKAKAPVEPPDFRPIKWRIDARPVLARGEGNAFDRGVVGDPCVVWDDTIGTWRMFYFASGVHPTTGARGPRTAMALAASAEQIGPGDWKKVGLVEFTNPEALINPNDFHKWWVITDARQPNHAAKIDGLYWAVFTASIRIDGQMYKHLQVASSPTLGGPWTLRAEPIAAPGKGSDLDALHADTPSAFWFGDRQLVAIYYKGYPTQPQAEQPRAPFGSGTILATWHPRDAHAKKVKILMRAGKTEVWNQGWMSSIQLFYSAQTNSWYGLHNASPTPPADQSHREPAPSLGGWVVCQGDPIGGTWSADNRHSPFFRLEDLSAAEKAAGVEVNFWRHYLLRTPQGKVRIFFNSGAYGKEQMYSLVPAK